MKSYEEYYTEFMDSLFNRQKKPIVNSIWKRILVILLIAHVIYFYLIGLSLNAPAGGMASIVLAPLGLLLTVIDFITVLSYIFKQKPRGILKVTSIIVFAIVSFLLALFVAGVISILNPNLFIF